MAEVTINGRALSFWNATLLAGSYASLLTPPQPKEWVSNENPRKNGVEYITPDELIVGERDVNLIFMIAAKTKDDFLASYNRFINTIQTGIVDLYVPELGRHYFLKYNSCTSFDNYNLRACKVAVKFTEPNPTKTT